MADEHKTQSEASIEQALYAIEDTIPAGSPDKARASREEQLEQYPIPRADPNPFRRSDSADF